MPGGIGTRGEALVAPVVEFVGKMYPKLRYLVSVCTGVTIVAKTGVLDGRRATMNKRSWAWATAQGPNVNWVPQARWVGRRQHMVFFWRLGGDRRGLRFRCALYGDDVAGGIANSSEYVRWLDPNYPFAAVWNVTK